MASPALAAINAQLRKAAAEGPISLENVQMFITLLKEKAAEPSTIDAYAAGKWAFIDPGALMTISRDLIDACVAGNGRPPPSKSAPLWRERDFDDAR